MVVGDTSRPKLSYRKSIISHQNMSGHLASCSNNASRIRGIILASQPTRFAGLVVVPNRRSLDRILRIAHSLHSTVSAIALLGNSRSIIAWICSRWDGTSCGAIGCYDVATCWRKVVRFSKPGKRSLMSESSVEPHWLWLELN